MFKKTGEYSQHKSNNPAQTHYYTFTPCPLFNNNFITLDPELIVLLTSAHKALGILEGMSIYLPDSEIIRELMLLKESCSSLQIDGKGLPFEKAINGAAPLTEERSTVDNTIIAIKTALKKSLQPAGRISSGAVGLYIFKLVIVLYKNNCFLRNKSVLFFVFSFERTS